MAFDRVSASVRSAGTYHALVSIVSELSASSSSLAGIVADIENTPAHLLLGHDDDRRRG